MFQSGANYTLINVKVLWTFLCMKSASYCHFTSRIPEKELIPGIIRQGGNCLESQAQDTTGNVLAGMGNCKETVNNPPVTQVRQASVWCFSPAPTLFIT